MIDLEAIRGRLAAYKSPDHVNHCDAIFIARGSCCYEQGDIEALIAEVERLSAQNGVLRGLAQANGWQIHDEVENADT